ncbi:MAG TPA: DUF6371 domain-containing protein, partial [Flavisolibacter sp.]|nr:DUF6371 domain-containing protein [Flavisolibacter sp.]
GTVKGAFSAETPESSPAVFWFINEHKDVRAGQIKLFNGDCNTVKIVSTDGEVRPCTTWMHSYLKKQHQRAGIEPPQWIYDYTESEKVTCFYGQHLLSKYKSKPIALVEAPKTCILGALLYPSYLWLATGSLSYFTKERARVLAGRKVVIFPDSGIPNPKTGKTCADLWQERLNEFSHIAHFHLSTLLERKATAEEKESGADLADYWLRELKNRPVNIALEDIIQGRGGHYTGTAYCDIIIQTIVTKQGKVYDLFFDSNGELLTPQNSSQAIEKLAHDFNKTLTISSFNGSPCLLHIY